MYSSHYDVHGDSPLSLILPLTELGISGDGNCLASSLICQWLPLTVSKVDLGP